MLYPNGRILIFAKAPVAGMVKTRLLPALNSTQCAILQQRLIDHTLNVSTSSQLCPVELWCTDTQHEYMQRCKAHYNIALNSQKGQDLGKRMLHALNMTLKDAAFAIIIGTDCPVIDRNHLLSVATVLNQSKDEEHKNNSNFVLTPAEDGGYVLVGTSFTNPELFTDIQWGSSEVLEQTRHKLQHACIDHTEMETLWDIDRPEDLARLQKLPIGKTLLGPGWQ